MLPQGSINYPFSVLLSHCFCLQWALLSTAMAPITCGSVGDIVTIIELCLKLARVLNDSTGSSKEYRNLISELNSLQDALRLAGVALSDSGLDHDRRFYIDQEVARCHSTLKETELHIAKYRLLGTKTDPSMKGNWCKSMGATISRGWKKICWAIIMPDPLATLKDRLTVHRDIISMNMSALNM